MIATTCPLPAISGSAARSHARDSLMTAASPWRLALCIDACERHGEPCGELLYRETLAFTPRMAANLAGLSGTALPPLRWLGLRVVRPTQGQPLQEWLMLPGWCVLTPSAGRRLSAWLLEESGRHLLRHARYGRYAVTPPRLAYFRRFMASNGFGEDQALLDSSMLLELYGLRPAQDLDYLALLPERESRPCVYRNDAELVHHGVSCEVLLKEPACHIRLDGVRCVSFNQLKRFKASRGSFKDRRDLGMMRALEAGNRPALWWHRGLYELDLVRRRLRRWLSRWLHRAVQGLPSERGQRRGRV